MCIRDSFIDSQSSKENPFFLYLAYNAPHAPLQATEKYLNRFTHIKDKKRRTYAAMVSAVDDGVGRVMKTLANHSIEENTIVVFLSDNGGAITKNSSNNAPLRGAKSDLFEGGIRVPFALQWKGTVPAGQIFNDPVISLDILGTIAGVTQVPIASERPLDGVNLIPYLTGQTTGAPHDILFWRKWEQNALAVRQGAHKYIINRKNMKPALYDLGEDIDESDNRLAVNETYAEALLEAWEKWNANLKDRVFPTLMNDNWWER